MITDTEMAVHPDDFYTSALEAEMCEHCESRATHLVMFSLRVAGTDFPVGKYCKRHAVAERGRLAKWAKATNARYDPS
jgi:hypothetical protein